MLVSEFIDRTGYQPSAEEYAEIEQAYYVFDGDKDAFCRAWCKANPHKAGTLWAAIKEQQRLGKVFDKVAEFVRKCKSKREDFYYMNYCEQQAFMDSMQEKCKCKDRRELRDMVYRLTKAVAVWENWKYQNKDLLWQLEMMA